MTIKTQPLSEQAGLAILNDETTNIFDLDQEEIIRLFQDSGFLLFRGFETDVNIFTRFTDSLSKDFKDYTGGVFNRRIINGNPTVLTVNDFKDEVKLHGEMYYQQDRPLMLWFFCEQPPLEDGETILCDGRQLFHEFPSHLKNLFGNKKLKYVAHLNKEAWQKRYKTDDLKVVGHLCESNNTTLDIKDDESIVVQYICPAIHPSRCANYTNFINSLLPAKRLSPKVVWFDDDSEITDELVAEIEEIAEKLTTKIAWKKGDILMVDNTRIMHGRRAFADNQRDIYLRLCSPAFSLDLLHKS